MNRIKNYEKFKNSFKQKYPNFEIIEFTNLTSPILFKDNEGYIHRKYEACRILRNGVRVDSIIDKFNYVQDKLNIIFPNLKLIEFKGFKSKLLVEDKNGFRYNPSCNDLLNSHPPTIQTCTQKEELFLFKANKIHNNLYNYENFKYINGKQKINIICKIHGIFEQSIESHLNGNGCKKCNCGGFSKESWLKRSKNKLCIFYILRIYNNDENFLKIGITTRTIKDRYSSLNQYNYDILYKCIFNSSFTYDLEKFILKKFKNKKYIPEIYFPGITECININEYNNIIQFINEKTKNSPYK